LTINSKTMPKQSDFQLIRDELNWGDQMDIANRLMVSASLVSHVLNGKKRNADILKAAIELAKQRKKEREELNKSIQSIAS
jgi:DNA transposition AAA+ family ATPase